MQCLHLEVSKMRFVGYVARIDNNKLILAIDFRNTWTSAVDYSANKYTIEQHGVSKLAVVSNILSNRVLDIIYVWSIGQKTYFVREVNSE